MNSKFEKGKKGGKQSTASSKKNAAPKDKEGIFDESFDNDWEQYDADAFEDDAELFDDAPKIKKNPSRGKHTGDDDFDFEDDLPGLSFLDESYYDDDDDLY